MRRWIMVLAVMIAGTMSMPAFASELDELKATILQLQKRIEQLQKRRNPPSRSWPAPRRALSLYPERIRR
jgi:hypothetical protein